MSAATLPTARRKALPYPELCDAGNPMFWLSAYQRDQAELDALDRLAIQACRNNRSTATKMALAGACGHQKEAASRSLGHVVSAGLLLMAFPETTALQVAACQTA